MTCSVCGAAFVPNPHAPHQRYCSRACRNRRTRPRESWAEVRQRAERKAECRVCPACGGSFAYVHKLRERFCSLRCARSVNLGARCAWRCEIPWHRCRVCGTFFVRHRKRIVCSDRCAHLEARTRAMASYVPTPARAYKCVECGEEFRRQGRHGSPTFCSKQCFRKSPGERARHADAAHRRRVRMRGGTVGRVDRREIFKRDGWRCHICGKKVDPSLSYPHPQSASLDHLVPVASGGSHEAKNVALAHWLCNSKRREVGPAQLILFDKVA